MPIRREDLSASAVETDRHTVRSEWPETGGVVGDNPEGKVRYGLGIGDGRERDGRESGGRGCEGRERGGLLFTAPSCVV